MTPRQTAWLIEAPGPRYLGTREIGHSNSFYWTADANAATRFADAKQADGVMMAVRQLEPSLFAFAVLLGDAWPREHKWLARLCAEPPRVDQTAGNA